MANGNCCDDIVGGLIYITQGDIRFETKGDAKIKPSGIERTAISSAGGRLVVTEKAVPATAELTFYNHCDADPIDLFDARCHVDVTVVEKSRSIGHLFTHAAIVGSPDINLESGEVTGIMIASRIYSRTPR